MRQKTLIRISLCVSVFILIPASNVEILMSKTEKCYSLVCQAVEAFSQSEAVQEVGCCLLWKFTSGGQKMKHGNLDKKHLYHSHMDLIIIACATIVRLNLLLL